MDKQTKLNLLDQVKQYHCGLIQNNQLRLQDCALVFVLPSGNLIINSRLPEAPDSMTCVDFIELMGNSSFDGRGDIPFTLIPWNAYSENLHQSFRKGWRYNYDISPWDLDVDPWHVNFITYDIGLCQETWVGVIKWYRNRALKQLDIEFNMSLEQSDTDGVEEIGHIKKMLRDLPQDINIKQYDTVPKLISFWPTLLLPAPDFVAPRPPEVPDLDDV
jgi:hypothetical protein